MSVMPLIDMQEATRLTREGRLSEAMALLQGRTRQSAPAQGSHLPPAPWDGADIIEMQPPVSPGEAWTARSPQTSQPAGPAPFKGKIGLLDALHAALEPKDAGASPSRRAPYLVQGARFEDRTYADHAGARAYKLYVPSRFDGEPLPLVVMLHGCTQSPDDFAAGTQMNTLAEKHLFLVAYPAQPQSANAQKCWNWFNAGDQRRHQGEPALIAGITRQVMRDFPVDAARVYVAGLSAGGAAAAIMGSTYPDIYAAIGVHSGLACGAASDMPSAFSAMRQGGNVRSAAARKSEQLIPTIVFHGDRDTTVSAINGDQVIAQSRAGAHLDVKVDKGQTKGGVTYTRTVHSDDAGKPVLEQWVLHGAGHAWSGGEHGWNLH